MVGFLKKIFGSKEKERRTRSLTHPRELAKNDIIRFRFLPQEELSGKRFQVETINCYVFDKVYPEFTLIGEDGLRLFLMLGEVEQREVLMIARPLRRKDAAALFDLQEFSRLFEDKTHMVELVRQAEPEGMSNWTSPRYFQDVDAMKGHYHTGDFRNLLYPPLPERGKGLDYYLLVGEQEERTVEVEVYDNGSTEIYLALRLPISSIAEMWPAALE